MKLSSDYKKTIISYKGPINVDVIVFFANYLKQILYSNQKTFIKIYKIFIELTQNISFYSSDSLNHDNEHPTGIGQFELKDLGEFYEINSLNMVTHKDGEVLNQNCFNINQLDMEGIRELKRKTRKKSEIKDTGAHIGLMHISLLSQSKLTYKITPFDEEYSFFKIGVKIKKHN